MWGKHVTRVSISQLRGMTTEKLKASLPFVIVSDGERVAGVVAVAKEPFFSPDDALPGKRGPSVAHSKFIPYSKADQARMGK